TGDLWIGDVGQDTIEELDVLLAGQQAGRNLGWSMLEGDNCFHAPCDATDKVAPKFTKTHAEGWCSVIGGQVYRGTCFPDIVGTYYFTDYCAHKLEAAQLQPDGSVAVTELATTIINLDGSMSSGSPVTPSSIHAASDGELYMTTTTCCGTSATGG